MMFSYEERTVIVIFLGGGGLFNVCFEPIFFAILTVYFINDIFVIFWLLPSRLRNTFSCYTNLFQALLNVDLILKYSFCVHIIQYTSLLYK